MKDKYPPLRSWMNRLRRAIAIWAASMGLVLFGASAMAGGPLDRLTLLVPDGADLNSWQVKVWTDSAAEEGIRLVVLRDAELLAMGSSAAANIAGLVVPDSAHMRASDALIAAIKQYVFLGGKLMLVYDAGVLTEGGFFPLAGNSRFADLVGVDYVFWNGGLGAATMVGFGQVVGTKGRLESLSFPPGKYLPYVAPASLASATFSTAFVPSSSLDPGGTQTMRTVMLDRATKGIDDGSATVRSKRVRALRDLLGLGVESTGPLRFDRRNPGASKSRDKHIHDLVPRLPEFVGARLNPDRSSSTELTLPTYPADDATLHAISGYAFGPLGYFHYVTTGNFPGTVHLSSPEHGLVAGTRTYGSGQLLFVNLPLGYFKAIGTDGAPLHGYLSHFAREQVGISTMSVQPRAVGGLIYNWHVDDGDDLNVNVKDLLGKNVDVMKRGPYSIHFTAGPDVITFGDGKGMDLRNNKTGKDLMLRLGRIGKKYIKGDKELQVKHAIGAHGGWIHDYWGGTANEANVPDLTHLLVQNFQAIESVTGQPIREYSSPQGNTPVWAVKWLERHGVVAMYMVADVGAGMLRSWRGGARLTEKLWSSPVTPMGKYATFEEFDEFGITDAMSGQWLLDLQSFVVNRRVNRMIYSHPPGVAGHLNPVNALLRRSDLLDSKDRFSWYTMSDLADFSQRRVETTWTSSTTAGVATFNASHPVTLENMSWMLPKARYAAPVVTSGAAAVTGDSLQWIVTANAGTTLRFQAALR